MLKLIVLCDKLVCTYIKFLLKVLTTQTPHWVKQVIKPWPKTPMQLFQFSLQIDSKSLLGFDPGSNPQPPSPKASTLATEACAPEWRLSKIISVHVE